LDIFLDILSHMTTDYDPTNIFAKILRGDVPCHRVYEDDATLAFMDIMPRSDGHTLVLPREPVRTILDISLPALRAVMETTQKIAKAAQLAFKADGLTIQQFNEAAGGQEVFHLHVHVLPRFKDTPLRPAGIMADSSAVAAHAEKIRTALKELSL
jgi:histidine triad (HIT) family protein